MRDILIFLIVIGLMLWHLSNTRHRRTFEEASSWFKGKDYELIPGIYHRYGVYIEPNETPNSANFTFYINGDRIETVTSTHPLANQTIHLSMEVATEDYQEGLQGQPIDDYNGIVDEQTYLIFLFYVIIVLKEK